MRSSVRDVRGSRCIRCIRRSRGLLFVLVFGILLSQAALPASALWAPPQTPTCNAVYLVNTDSNTVIYEKNQNQKIYPASTTKLMTAILVYEKFKNALNTPVKVELGDITPLYGKYGSLVPLKVGETLTVEQLLYCLLVKSGDDSADTLARAAAGSIPAFVDQMNAKAKALGAKDTHYMNPHGLHDPDHYTTAYDTFLIEKYAMQYDELAKIVATPQYTLPASGAVKYQRSFVNTNYTIVPGHRSFYYPYVKGGKTGTTTPAGACLVSYAQKNGITYYCVAMGGRKSGANVNTAFSETKALYEWAFGNFGVRSIVKTTDTAAQVKVEFSNTATLSLMPAEPLNALVPSSYRPSDLKITLHVPASVRAPVAKGAKLGTEDVAYVDPQTKKVTKLGTLNLLAGSSVERSRTLYMMYLVRQFFSSKWFKLAAGCLIFLLVAYIALSVYLNRRKNSKNRRRPPRRRY